MHIAFCCNICNLCVFRFMVNWQSCKNIMHIDGGGSKFVRQVLRRVLEPILKEKMFVIFFKYLFSKLAKILAATDSI